jgi:hypothetical protein
MWSKSFYPQVLNITTWGFSAVVSSSSALYCHHSWYVLKRVGLLSTKALLPIPASLPTSLLLPSLLRLHLFYHIFNCTARRVWQWKHTHTHTHTHRDMYVSIMYIFIFVDTDVEINMCVYTLQYDSHWHLWLLIIWNVASETEEVCS